MKITAERLRQIITEEVIKEELAPEIAAPAIAAMLQGTEAAMTSDIFGAVFDQMYGEGALEDEAERMANAEEPEEEEFPTEYQPGGGEGDRPVMGFKESLQAVIMEELRSVLAEATEIPDLAKAGPELEELIQQVLPGIEKASQGNENLKKLALQRVFQLLQQEGDVKPMQEGVDRIIEEEYYIHLIEEELRHNLLTEAKEHLYPRLSSAEKSDLFMTAQKNRRSKPAQVMSRYLLTTDVEDLRDAEEQGLAKLVYQMSNPGRQYLYDQGGGLANVQPEQLKAADDRFEDQASAGPKAPLTTEPTRTYKTSASDQPASTSGSLDWFLGRWRDFTKSASPEEFRAEVDRSKEYLPDGKSIIEYLKAFLEMLRNHYEHDYESAAL